MNRKKEEMVGLVLNQLNEMNATPNAEAVDFILAWLDITGTNKTNEEKLDLLTSLLFEFIEIFDALQSFGLALKSSKKEVVINKRVIAFLSYLYSYRNKPKRNINKELEALQNAYDEFAGALAMQGKIITHQEDLASILEVIKLHLDMNQNFSK